MTSRMKWALVPSLGMLISLSIFVWLLGSIWAVAVAPFIGLSGGLMCYGLIVKVKAFDNLINWMNKDN